LIFSLDYNYDVLEKLEMDKICSVTVTATVHDAVHNIQDQLMETNEQVRLKRIFRLFLYIFKKNFSCYYLMQNCDKSNIVLLIY